MSTRKACQPPSPPTSRESSAVWLFLTGVCLFVLAAGPWPLLISDAAGKSQALQKSLSDFLWLTRRLQKTLVQLGFGSAVLHRKVDFFFFLFLPKFTDTNENNENRNHICWNLFLALCDTIQLLSSPQQLLLLLPSGWRYKVPLAGINTYNKKIFHSIYCNHPQHFEKQNSTFQHTLLCIYSF